MDWLKYPGEWFFPMLNTFGFVLSLAAPVGAALMLWICRKWATSVKEQKSDLKFADLVTEMRAVAEAFLFSQYRILALVLLLAFGLLSAARGFGPGISLLWGGICALSIGWASGRMVTSCALVAATEGRDDNNRSQCWSCASPGVIMGLVLSGMSVFGPGILFYFFHQPDLVPNIAGFCLGASLVALFACVGGGVIARASESVSRKLPRDFQDRPWAQTVIGVSKHLGSAGELALDIFGSYSGALIGTMIIASTLSSDGIRELTVFNGSQDEDSPYRRLLICLPLVVSFLGLISSWAGLRILRGACACRKNSEMKALLLAAGLLLGSSLFFIELLSCVRAIVWFALAVGCIAGFAIILFAKYFSPSRVAFENVMGDDPLSGSFSGLASGLRTVSVPLLILAVVLSIANSCAGLYGVGLAAVGMLSAGAVAVSLESCVIISRFAESMTGRRFAARMTDETASGDAVETELTEQYFNVLSAALTALVLFAAYTQVVSGGVEVSLVDPSVIVGLFVGAAVAGSFAVLIMSAVGKIAFFLRERTDIQSSLTFDSAVGRAKAASRQVEDLCRATFRELVIPALLALACPLVVALLGPDTLGGMLMGALITGIVLSLFVVSTSGSGLSFMQVRAQKLQSGEPGLGSSPASCLVEEPLDAVFLGVVWPAMNILIKLMAVFALVFAQVM